MTQSLTFAFRVAHRIRSDGLQVLPWILGRFYIVRCLYSFQRRALGKTQIDRSGNTIFPGVDIAEALEAIHRHAVYLRVRIPDEYVNELRTFAATQPLTVKNGPAGFRYQDVKNGRLPDGEVVTLAQIRGIQDHPVAKRIAEDPVALAVLAGYLGYAPRYEIRLYWSFVTDANLELRQRTGQTVEYHYDVHAYNFAYAAYYLTDTDDSSGAHVMVTGSHREKPTAWLFGSSRKSDQEVNERYTANRILTISGKAGDGFWQDSSCYHKALPPRTSDRLLLQVRYY